MCMSLSAHGDAEFLHAKNRIENSYIVQFDAAARHGAEQAIAAVGGLIVDQYTIITADAVVMTEKQAQALAHVPGIAMIEENALLETAPTQTGLNVQLNNVGNPATLWGIDRIDQLRPSDARVNNSYTYCYNGAGVRAYIVDTGVRPDYGDIAGRVDSAIPLKNLLGGYPSTNPTYLNPRDCWNSDPDKNNPEAAHGTGVATIVGGTVWGVAKGVTLVDARANDCAGKGNTTRMLRVIQWICQEDVNRAGHASVINISSAALGQYTGALNSGITSAVDTYNIPVVTAAGNFSDNAFWYWPGNSDRTINVGGLNQNGDTLWSYSNYGFNIEFYAPAQYVESGALLIQGGFQLRDEYRSETSNCANNYYDTCTSGTSFAAPHVTGVIARYRQAHPNDPRNTIVNALKQRVINNNGPYAYEWQTGYYIPILVYGDCGQ